MANTKIEYKSFLRALNDKGYRKEFMKNTNMSNEQFSNTLNDYLAESSLVSKEAECAKSNIHVV